MNQLCEWRREQRRKEKVRGTQWVTSKSIDERVTRFSSKLHFASQFCMRAKIRMTKRTNCVSSRTWSSDIRERVFCQLTNATLQADLYLSSTKNLGNFLTRTKVTLTLLSMHNSSTLCQCIRVPIIFDTLHCDNSFISVDGQRIFFSWYFSRFPKSFRKVHIWHLKLLWVPGYLFIDKKAFWYMCSICMTLLEFQSPSEKGNCWKRVKQNIYHTYVILVTSHLYNQKSCASCDNLYKSDLNCCAPVTDCYIETLPCDIFQLPGSSWEIVRMRQKMLQHFIVPQ